MLKLNRMTKILFFNMFINDEPISNCDFNSAFSYNYHYDSSMPVARNQSLDIKIAFKSYNETHYDSNFVHEISNIERYMINNKVAFFTCMHAVLPTFYLITKDNEEIKIDNFITVSEHGLCSISQTYNTNMKFSKDLNDTILHFKNIVGIKFDYNTREILDINTDDKSEYITYYEKDLTTIFSNLEPLYITLDIAKIIIHEYFEKTKNLKGSNLSHTIHTQLYRTYQFETSIEEHKSLLYDIRRIAKDLPSDYIFNPNTDDMGKEITQIKGVTTYCFEEMLIEIKDTHAQNTINTFYTYYSLFNYFLRENIKIYNLIHELKQNEIESFSQSGFDEFNEEDLIEFKARVSQELNTDMLCDFCIDKYFTAKAIFSCVNTEKYLNELQKIFNRIENSIIKQKHYKEKEAHKKHQEAQEKELKREQKINRKMQFLSILLSIPASISLVDIFYSEYFVPKIIFFPSPIAKLLLIAFCFWFACSCYNKDIK